MNIAEIMLNNYQSINPSLKTITLNTCVTWVKTSLCFFFLVFFSDKGLLAVAQLISAEAMYKVVINLDMTHVQYEQIINNCSAQSTVPRHLQLLKAALKINRKEPKIQRLLSALRESDENTIATKIEALYKNKMSLSKSNLSKEMQTVVSNTMEDTTISGKD